MGSTHRFIEDPNEDSQIRTWFLNLEYHTEVLDQGRNTTIYFKDFGDLIRDDSGKIDTARTPIVNLFLPQVFRSIIWTVGEVHFLPTPLRERFPQLQKVAAQFQKWLRANECVFSNKPGTVWSYDYYLEGSIRNYDPPVFALQSGLVAIKNGQYFVSDDDGPILDKLCQTLRLRGIGCLDY